MILFSLSKCDTNWATENKQRLKQRRYTFYTAIQIYECKIR